MYWICTVFIDHDFFCCKNVCIIGPNSQCVYEKYTDYTEHYKSDFQEENPGMTFIYKRPTILAPAISTFQNQWQPSNWVISGDWTFISLLQFNQTLLSSILQPHYPRLWVPHCVSTRVRFSLFFIRLNGRPDRWPAGRGVRLIISPTTRNRWNKNYKDYIFHCIHM